MVYAGNQPKLRVLKEDAVPHVFPWSPAACTVSGRNRIRSAEKRKLRHEKQLSLANKACTDVSHEEIVNDTMDDTCGKIIASSIIYTDECFLLQFGIIQHRFE